MVTCADTSFLFAVYGNDSHTPRALSHLEAQTSPLGTTLLNRFELVNALRFAERRKTIRPGEAAEFAAQFEADLRRGLLVEREFDLQMLFASAGRLSEKHTLTGGHRGFDILHVAAAKLLGAERFLTFDANQKRLAEAEGIVVPC
jgi:predicted nucleic acid-binding protein